MLYVRVRKSFFVSAGTFEIGGNATIVEPPTHSMFEQLVDWLLPHPLRDPPIRSGATMGIGATALCLRWGSYLAVLLDETKDLDPRAESAEVSMVSNQEMKRINLEVSANLARLLRMLHDDEVACCRLLCLSYQHLPMPDRQVRQCSGFLDVFDGLTSPDFWNRATAEWRARINEVREVVTRHPYRILANSLVLASYRNGPIERLHSGRVLGYSLNRRRATDRQVRELLQFTSDRLATVLLRMRPWEQHPGHLLPWPENLAGIYLSPVLTPKGWSLSDSSCTICLPTQ